ncbi:HepT-like ribonuclease domain-containing protein [Fulvimarina sp. MAC3]|uniref:HepT-like ribonuclease domain-containing protein n=1 Tax=Fulvimarina sp. MAC3 TaxID=3148887 RepID=UPI0031FC98DA
MAAWSLLEASFRYIDTGEASVKRFAPGTVLQSLSMEGYIEEEREEALRNLVDTRNRIVHGDLEIEPTNEMVELVLDTVETVLKTDADL